MMMRPPVAAAAFALAIASIAPPILAQTQVFRATTAQVSVSASVKKGNNVVANLAAKDFALTDNGVAQTITAISMDSVPIDVTLFLDPRGGPLGKPDEVKPDHAANTQVQLRIDNCDREVTRTLRNQKSNSPEVFCLIHLTASP